jgi:hypothetical protein
LSRNLYVADITFDLCGRFLSHLGRGLGLGLLGFDLDGFVAKINLKLLLAEDR